MDDIFFLKGRAVDGDGASIEGLFLAIVDDDSLDEPDLIGLGRTREDGSFSLTFLGSEFRQDFMEMETTPDLRIVASLVKDDGLKPIAQRAFRALEWEGGSEDLGDIVFTEYTDNPTILDGVDPLPGYNKTAERLEIDNEMVLHCLAEVTPLVEKLTGWSNLAEGLTIVVQDGTNNFTMAEHFKARGIDPDSLEAQLQVWFADNIMAPGMGCALYDPGTHSIIINQEVMNQTGLDALKIIVGHELVHVGQFKYTPGLSEYQRDMLRGLPADATPEDLEKLQAKSAVNMELEGYAKYIESDFLQKYHYPMATLYYHASFMDQMVHGFVASLVAGTANDSGETTEAKQSQYVDGREIYRQRETTPGVPARFELDLTRYPDGENYV